ncbi:MAG TPA: ATP-binding protein [Acidobacteriota bacterium]|nr:ATP-binding protein [Acidobacteriota bacterium]
MTTAPDDLVKQFRIALLENLEGAGEGSLERAYQLGRKALDSGIGIVELIALELRVLTDVLAATRPGESSVDIVRATQAFFVESLSPFEMTHRGFEGVTVTLRRLNEHLNDKLEEAAKRLATALHDEAWQILSVVHIDLALAEQNLPDGARKHLMKVRDSLKELEQQLRSLSHEIRPKVLDEHGVVPALRFLAQGVSSRTGIPITVDGPAGERLPPRIETNIYRIVQEALTNLSRHSGAAHASIRLQSDSETMICSVQDDGVGFNLQETLAKKEHHGLGLLGMQERTASMGGTLHINSSPEKGTEILVTIPLDRHSSDPAVREICGRGCPSNKGASALP